MALIATLVLGRNGAASLNGGSTLLSTPPDRARFLALHRRAAAYIIGRESASIESYQKSSSPIYVLSRSREAIELAHPRMEQVFVSEVPGENDLEEVTRVIAAKNSGDVVIEAGPSLLLALVRCGAVDELELSITSNDGDGDFINLEELLSFFEIIEDAQIDDTRLLKCRYQGNSTNS